jgi:hypothetical protein
MQQLIRFIAQNSVVLFTIEEGRKNLAFRSEVFLNPVLMMIGYV